MQDLTRAAVLFAPVHARTGTVDGFVSLEVPPLLAYVSSATVKQAKALHALADRLNLFIKIPGTGDAASKRGFGRSGNERDLGLFLHPTIAVDAVHAGMIVALKANPLIADLTCSIGWSFR